MTFEIAEVVKRSFANRFLKWEILIDEAVINGAKAHVINKAGWHIKFVKGNNEQGHYYEFYAQHPSITDMHFRIYDSGFEEELEILTDGYDYNPSLPGDQTLQRESFIASNRKVYESLKAAGLQM